MVQVVYKTMKNILLVNPWIYDFAAYDLWLKPWGLLKISTILKKNGFNVYFVDAMDRRHVLINKKNKDFVDGTGKFPFKEIKKPKIIKDVPRKYKRYGLSSELFKRALPEADIDIILVSSGMTYWYLGAFKTIRMLKKRYKGVPIVLGGVYATLEYKHALKNSGANYVLGNKELEKLSEILGSSCDFSFQNILNESIDYSWYQDASYGVLRISLGCPFNCAYCAQKLLSPPFFFKNMDSALEEITVLWERGIRNFAFYDDALLVDEEYITSYLEKIILKGIEARFYTPNGLHARYVTEKTARLMKKAHFIDPILSLETVKDNNPGFRHNKVTKEDLENAVFFLKKAGYKTGEYWVYLMLGAPGDSLEDVKDSIEFVNSLGGKVSLSEFSPIPGTPAAEKFTEVLKEPLLQNNSIFPLFDQAKWKDIRFLKHYAHELNSSLF